MMGVVTSVGQLGSVKRKSDNSELSRRDVTLLDQRWGFKWKRTDKNRKEKKEKKKGNKKIGKENTEKGGKENTTFFGVNLLRKPTVVSGCPGGLQMLTAVLDHKQTRSHALSHRWIYCILT